MVGITQALQGLSSTQSQFDTAASKIAQWPASQAAQSTAPQPQDQVDLSTQAVALLQSKNSFEANTKLIKVADEMEQSTLNMIG